MHNSSPAVHLGVSQCSWTPTRIHQHTMQHYRQAHTRKKHFVVEWAQQWEPAQGRHIIHFQRWWCHCWQVDINISQPFYQGLMGVHQTAMAHMELCDLMQTRSVLLLLLKYQGHLWGWEKSREDEQPQEAKTLNMWSSQKVHAGACSHEQCQNKWIPIPPSAL